MIEHRQLARIVRNWRLYLFIAPTLAYFLIFHYVPLYGLQIAFKDFNVAKGIWASEWIGFEHFEIFFGSYFFWVLLKNTFLINLYQLLLFPVPVIVALSLNELKNGLFKKTAQTITYAPHFISAVVLSGMVISFLGVRSGIVNQIIVYFGGEPVHFMIDPDWFKTIYVLSGEWQSFGWGAIIYLAALAGVNPELHEAAAMDGATRMQRIAHINIPGILPTIVILFILNMGHFMSIGFERIYLLQNELNLESADVIQTYVYRVGLLQGKYDFSAAVGLFNSVINLILLVTVNQMARKVNETSLW